MYSALATYKTIGENVIKVPAKRPKETCGLMASIFRCNRPAGHTGRHARIRYPLGTVRAVWRDDASR